MTMKAAVPANRLLDAALAYAERGWPVFPLHAIAPDGLCTCRNKHCSSPGKHPRTKNGLSDASMDPAQIREWWKTWPLANVAIRTGVGLVVLDVDPDKGGAESLAALEQSHGALPRTYEVVTGRGGRHLYFRAAGTVPNSASLIGPGLDIRGDGGYVVSPPSATAREYAVDLGGGEGPEPIPEWLLRASLRKRAASSAPPSGDADAYMAGGRNVKLTSLGGTMRKRGMSQEAIEAALQMENARRCHPPLDEVEVKKIAASVARYAPAVGAEEGGEPTSGPDADEQPWVRELSRDRKGRPQRTFGNVCTILRNLEGVELAYCDMRLTPTTAGNPVTDVTIGVIREYLERLFRIDFGAELIEKAMVVVADEKHTHPVREYLESLTWDGEARVSRVPSEILGLAPDALTSSMTRRWFISAVARIFEPGCQVDTVLVLVGKQGARKSTFFRELSSPWFGESRMDISNRDAVMQLYTAWIYEWPEVDRITLGRDSSEVKSFLTQRVDTIRKPYARAVTQGFRHTVIVGTTNHETYLDDETGARRFWTLAVPGDIALEKLRHWKDQLWAEALTAYRAGEQWWLAGEEEVAHAAHSGVHAVEDPWLPVIRGWLERRAPNLGPVTAADVISQALSVPAHLSTKAIDRRVGACMKAIGYLRACTGVQRRRVWVKPSSGSGDPTGSESFREVEPHDR